MEIEAKRCGSRFPRLLLGSLMVLAVGIPASAVVDSPPSSTVDVSSAWWGQVQQEIAEVEYHVSWQERTKLPDVGQAWHAPNRAHDFRTYFTGDGIRVIRRTEAEPTWQWGLSLIGYGRDDRVWPPPTASLAPEANRIDYDRDRIVEWYVNDRRGLKQGFTLAVPPEQMAGTEGGLGARRGRPDDANDGTVYLVLALSGTLSPVISADGQSIDFVTPEGARVVRYAALEVTDAAGEALAAHMEGFTEAGVRGIRLVIDDRGAGYPLTIDPLATTPVWSVSSNQNTAHLGDSVATAGDVNGDGYSDVVVGAHWYDNGESNEGMAFVYHGSASGPSTSAAWTADGGQVEAHFGESVATAGDVDGDGYSDVVIGASFYDNSETNEGMVLLYSGSASGLSANPVWTAEGSDVGGYRFGRSVASAGDINGDGYADVIVGATSRAWIYSGSADGLSTSPAWAALGGGSFGRLVATAGDVNGDGYSDVIIGAPTFANGEENEGMAFVYHGSTSGLSGGPVASTEDADWTVESNQSHDQPIGTSLAVATAGDVNGDGYSDVIVGFRLYDNGETGEGVACLYLGSASGLGPTMHATPLDAHWKDEGDVVDGGFGWSVGTAGDVNGDGYADVIVGTHLIGPTFSGQIRVYAGSRSDLPPFPWEMREIARVDGSGGFGFSVATAGDVNGDGYSDVIVGAPWHFGTEGDEGRADIFLGSPAGLAATAGWERTLQTSFSYFGHSVASAGDVNGDGYADVIVGEYGATTAADQGRASVFHGSPDGPIHAAAWLVDGEQGLANLGYSVAGAGDVNGDGYSDVIVGAYRHDNGQVDEGQAHVYHGSATGLEAEPAWTGEGDLEDAKFGSVVASAGDVNGDGLGDAIIGSDNGSHVYHGSPAGLNGTQAWATADGWGATAGDVNGDGYSDVIVGSSFYTNGQTYEGRALVFDGSAIGLSATPSWTAEGDSTLAFFGDSVGTAGDVNGDGFSDVIVGAPLYSNGGSNLGRVAVYQGSPTGLPSVADWTVEGDQDQAWFGDVVATAGDVNGDGYADVIVGAPDYDDTFAYEGRAYVYHGSASGLGPEAGWAASGGQAEGFFGESVATAGDVNGDGYAEVIVGAPRYDSPTNDSGRVFLYYGNDGLGLSLRPQQRRATDTAPIGRLGASDAPDLFRLAALGRTPYGRGKVKLEWEVKPLGDLLTGIGTQTAVHWSDSGVLGGKLNEPVLELFDENVYHWRARLRYHPATTPFQQSSRWFTVPWNGWQEADLRTHDPGSGAGVVPDRAPDTPLRVDRHETAPWITLSWGASCMATDFDYEVYEGEIGDFASHVPRYCSTGGAMTIDLLPRDGGAYYLVVPRNSVVEGSYGTDSAGLERPQGDPACLPRQLGVCP